MGRLGSILIIFVLAMLIIVGYKYVEKVTGGAVKAETAKICFDSDGGKDFYAKGAVRVEGFNWSDVCADRPDMVPMRKNKVGDVIEYYCKEDGTYDTEAYTCPNRCAGGACVPVMDKVLLLDTVETTDLAIRPCSDFDNGKNYDMKGKISGSVIDPDTAEDECWLMGGKMMLAERYCFSKERGAVEYYDCSEEGKGCTDGACSALQPVTESKDWKGMYTVLSDKVLTKEPGCTFGGEGNFYPISQGYVNIPSGLTPTEAGFKGYVGRTVVEQCDLDSMNIKLEFYCDAHGYAHLARVKCDDACMLGACEYRGR